MSDQSTGMALPRSVSHYGLVAALLLLALACRLAALEAINDTPYASFLLPDERYYHDWAVDLLQGIPAKGPFEYAPLPAYLMALVYSFWSVDVTHIRILNILLSLLGCVMVYLTARCITSRSWALLALAFGAISAELVFYATVPLKTSLSFFLFALLVWLALLSIRHLLLPVYLCLGLVLGLAVLVRPNTVVLLPFLLPMVLLLNRFTINRTRVVVTGICFLSGFLMAVLPFILHNYSASGKISLLPVQSGFLFYCTNTASNPTPLYLPVAFASSHPDEQGTHFTIEASKREGRKLSEQEASRFWQRAVVEEVRQNPQIMLGKLQQKILMLFTFSENSDHYSLEVLAGLNSFYQLLVVKFHVFILLGYSGIIFGWKHTPKIRLISGIALAYLFTLLVYSSGNRFFLPLLAILIPASVWFLRFCWQKILARDLKVVAAIMVLMTSLVFIGKVHVTGTGDLTKHYNNLAFIHKENGDTDNAIAYWLKSNELQGSYSDVAALFLSGFEYQQHGVERAIARLHTIPENSFMASAKYATLGDFFKHHNSSPQALVAYQKSLSINYSQRRVRREILGLLSLRDPLAMQVAKELRWLRSFYEE